MNKKNHHLLLLVFTILSITVLLGIQINWMLKTARMQETQFKHAVSLVLSKTVENLREDKAICAEITNCLLDSGTQSCSFTNQNRIIVSGLDSLIRRELKSLNIDLDFEFELVEKGTLQVCPSQKNIYINKTLDGVVPETDYELSIRFPEKKEFIKAQMGSIFISSIALLMLVCASIVLIYRFLEHEKRLTRNLIDFLNNITHEVKTPLTNISLASNIISKHPSIETDSKLSSYVKVIRTEHQRLKEKVEMLLKATLLESDIPIEETFFSADDEISGVVSVFDVQIHERQGQISVCKSGNNFLLSGNVDLFRIAIGNLIDNAIKYCFGNPHIKIDLISRGNHLKISVADNGIGISQKHLPRVFDKYFRVRNGDTHSVDGFGLGLFFVKSTITKMKGHVTVTSEQGEGSVFTLKIPLVCN